jgi:acyl dehydratase
MSSERVFESPPSMLQLFARAGVGLVPGASRLPFIGAGAGGGEVPSLTLSLPHATVDRDRLTAYCRVCAFQLSDSLPATYPHILAFPLHLALMTDPSFPFPAIGLVHISNQITQRRPIRADETLALRVWPTQLEPHPRGRQFSIRTEATVDGEVVWEEVSTNLRRGGGDGGGSSATDTRERQSSNREPLPASATWRLPGDLGRRYAAVSGDINPIHMHSLSARLFGFPSAIAHGMWTKARCLAALSARLPDSFEVEVSFRRPILLPATVEFGEASAEDGSARFEVRDAKKGTPHLDGSLRPQA